MKLWIARDECGELSLHIYEPTYKIDEYDKINYWAGGRIGELPTSLFPEVSFENSPIEVELKIK